MRFVAEGPSIPDELLLARDQGRTVFFCGAGVSQARAKLPDFFGLADKVVSALGVLDGSPTRKLIQEAREVDDRVGIPGIISADRVFGLLERDFHLRDIQSAVAAALKPAADCDLTAHQIIIELATTPQGDVRLVTTNFDRLFSDCRPDLKVRLPPRLPDPTRASELNGITHLHGRAGSDYADAEEDGFVLSSSEFGSAYLAEAWATTFFREIVQQYVVVFIGYSADDPPIRYLLEALHRSPKTRNKMYAFQEGEINSATARWMQKGVEAIPYDMADQHAALWKTLEQWASRARDPTQWASNLVNLSRQGPGILTPHVRGQIAHLISTHAGMKRFSEDPPPPAEWLCVFDPRRRFDKPRHSGSVYDRGPYVDPFDLYGLDSDTSPSTILPDDHTSKREIPAGAWNGFTLTHLDREELQSQDLPSINGPLADLGHLPPRLSQLGMWIAKVCCQPAAIWWATHQSNLHQSIKNQIRWHLQTNGHPSTPESRGAWRWLLESWDSPREGDRRWDELAAQVSKDGWSSSAIRAFVSLLRPYLQVQTNYYMVGRPPAQSDNASIPHLVRREVTYPNYDDTIDVSDEWIAAAIPGLRANLEQAIVLEMETGGYQLDQFGPLDQEGEDGEDARFELDRTLWGAVSRYAALFTRFVRLDLQAARREFHTWDETNETIFTRLRIWAAGNSNLIEPDQLQEIFHRIPEEAFWATNHQRDLLLSLSRRWASFDHVTKDEIEKRLLAGPPQWSDEDSESFATRRAWYVLARLHWLARHGCTLSINLAAVTSELRQWAPQFTPEHADDAADARTGRSGFVRTETEHAFLLDIPLTLVLARAAENAGRSEDFVQRDPFAGLASSHPVRAFSALTHSAKLGEFPEWAWQRFLGSDERKNDSAKFSVHIANRLATYSIDTIGSLLRAVARWLQTTSKRLESYAALHPVFDKCLAALAADPSKGRSGIIRGSKKPDWVMEAINSPIGHVAEALLDDPRIKGVKEPKPLPHDWQDLANQILSLPGDLGRYALVLFCHHLNLFYWMDPAWTEAKLLSSIESIDEETRTAAWVGYLWSGKVPNENLFVRIKSALFNFSTLPHQSARSYSEVLVAFILAGWGSENPKTSARYISNDEMRALLLNVDGNFRARVLWQLNRWANETRGNPQRVWDDRIVEFLTKVWPRQIAAKSPAISARLADLVLANKGRFLERFHAVMPHLTPIEGERFGIRVQSDEIKAIVGQHPKEILTLLSELLPDDARGWPYDIEQLLAGIESADPSLAKDNNLLSLKRKWDAR